MGGSAPHDAYPKAKAAAALALQLDPDLAEAHMTLATVEHEYEWKWDESETEFRRAVELNPNSSLSHKGYAEFLMHGGRNREAIEEADRAVMLDPSLLAPDCCVLLSISSPGITIAPRKNARQLSMRIQSMLRHTICWRAPTKHKGNTRERFPSWNWPGSFPIILRQDYSWPGTHVCSRRAEPGCTALVV